MDSEKGLLIVLKSVKANPQLIALAEKLVNGNESDRYNAYDAMQRLTDINVTGTCVELLRNAVLKEFDAKLKHVNGKISSFQSLKSLTQSEQSRRASESKYKQYKSLMNIDTIPETYLIELNGKA